MEKQLAMFPVSFPKENMDRQSIVLVLSILRPKKILPITRIERAGAVVSNVTLRDL
jgi:hypothetical protein